MSSNTGRQYWEGIQANDGRVTPHVRKNKKHLKGKVIKRDDCVVLDTPGKPPVLYPTEAERPKTATIRGSVKSTHQERSFLSPNLPPPLPRLDPTLKYESDLHHPYLRPEINASTETVKHTLIPKFSMTTLSIESHSLTGHGYKDPREQPAVARFTLALGSIARLCSRRRTAEEQNEKQKDEKASEDDKEPVAYFPDSFLEIDEVEDRGKTNKFRTGLARMNPFHSKHGLLRKTRLDPAHTPSSPITVWRDDLCPAHLKFSGCLEGPDRYGTLDLPASDVSMVDVNAWLVATDQSGHDTTARLYTQRGRSTAPYVESPIGATGLPMLPPYPIGLREMRSRAASTPSKSPVILLPSPSIDAMPCTPCTPSSTSRTAQSMTSSPTSDRSHRTQRFPDSNTSSWSTQASMQSGIDPWQMKGIRKQSSVPHLDMVRQVRCLDGTPCRTKQKSFARSPPPPPPSHIVVPPIPQQWQQYQPMLF